jgi:hypothetical protein
MADTEQVEEHLKKKRKGTPLLLSWTRAAVVVRVRQYVSCIVRWRTALIYSMRKPRRRTKAVSGLGR